MNLILSPYSLKKISSVKSLQLATKRITSNKGMLMFNCVGGLDLFSIDKVIGSREHVADSPTYFLCASV
jgi:hypothetical protein